MTKTIVIGETRSNRNNKCIKFLSVLPSENHATLKFSATVIAPPDAYDYVELICPKYNGRHDIMFAYDHPDDRATGCLYLGYWNEGVI
jgi:hypothetical protein